MPTISELMEGKKPGEIRVTGLSEYDAVYWFRPYYRIEGCWHGPDIQVPHYSWKDDDTWQLYTEPKPKVVRWLWALSRDNSGTFDGIFLDTEYMSEEEEALKPGIRMKLPFSQMEFEE